MSSDKTLGRARGLNSIADPADFKGSRGRRARGGKTETHPEDADNRPSAPPANEANQPTARSGEPPTRPTAAPSTSPVSTETETAPPAPGGAQDAPGAVQPAPVAVQPPAATPHRAVVPGMQRKRRELSVPVPVADAVAATGINAADVVMTAYRNHSDAVFNGSGGRMVARGRQRLRLSISDAEFDKLTRLGEARGWNRSETVTVLLTMALLDEPVA